MEDKTMTQDMKDCMTACISCAHICNRCSDDMIGMDAHHDAKLLSRCIRLCRDCAEICVLAGQWIGRMGLLSSQLCRLCAEVCDACADECEKHAPHHAMCGPCAQACRRCAELCRQMVVSAKAA